MGNYRSGYLPRAILVPDPGVGFRLRLWSIVAATALAGALPGNLFVLILNENASKRVAAMSWNGVGGSNIVFPGGTIVDSPNNRGVAFRVASSINGVSTDIYAYYTVEPG